MYTPFPPLTSLEQAQEINGHVGALQVCVLGMAHEATHLRKGSDEKNAAAFFRWYRQFVQQAGELAAEVDGQQPDPQLGRE